MNIQQARDIVYGFADILGAGAPWIPDAATLPWPKSTIKHAFDVYVEAMVAEKNKNPALFQREGYQDTLDQAYSVMLHIDDYHDIAEEDREAVARANARPKTDMWDDETMKLLMKYPVGGGQI